jgi:dCMP deaminase
MPHCIDVGCDTSEGKGCQRTSHAEINAIANAAKHGIATEGADLYCTLSPCPICAKAIVNAGIKRVYYYEDYRIREGLQLLTRAGIQCIQLNAVTVTVIVEPVPSASQQPWLNPDSLIPSSGLQNSPPSS